MVKNSFCTVFHASIRFELDNLESLERLNNKHLDSCSEGGRAALVGGKMLKGASRNLLGGCKTSRGTT